MSGRDTNEIWVREIRYMDLKEKYLKTQALLGNVFRWDPDQGPELKT